MSIRQQALRGLKRRLEFEDLVEDFQEDKGKITLPRRLHLNTLASFEFADQQEALLQGKHARKEAVAVAHATHSTTPGDPGNLVNPKPQAPPDVPMSPPGPPPPPAGGGASSVVGPSPTPGGTPRRGGGRQAVAAEMPPPPSMPPPPPPGAARIKRASGAQHFRMDADDKRKPPAPAEDLDMDDWQSVDSNSGPPPPPAPGAGAVSVAVATPAITQLAQAVQMHTSMLEAMHAERMSAHMAQMEAQVQGIQHQLLLEKQRQTIPPELVPTQPQNWQAIIKQEITQGMAFASSLAVPPDQDPQTAAAIQQQLAALHAAEHAAHHHAGGGNPEKGVKVSELVKLFDGQSSSGASGSGYPPGDFSHAKVPPQSAAPKFDFSGLARPEKPPTRGEKQKREEVSLRKEDYPNTRAYPRPQPRPARRSAAEKRKAVTQMNKERQEGFDQMKAARSEPEPTPAPKAAPKAKAQAKLAAQTTSTTAEPRAAPGPNARSTSAPPPRSNRKGNRKFKVTDAS